MPSNISANFLQTNPVLDGIISINELNVVSFVISKDKNWIKDFISTVTIYFKPISRKVSRSLERIIRRKITINNYYLKQ